MIADQPEFTSAKPFNPDNHLDALFLVCSDGRFEEHVNEFREHLRRTLGLKRLDRYFMPGSQLESHSSGTGHPNLDKATEYWTRFFIDKHHLNDVVIVGHELCAAYTSAPAYRNFAPDRLRRQQELDLLNWRDLILREYPKMRVHLYYMKPGDNNSKVDFFSIQS